MGTFHLRNIKITEKNFAPLLETIRFFTCLKSIRSKIYFCLLILENLEIMLMAWLALFINCLSQLLYTAFVIIEVLFRFRIWKSYKCKNKLFFGIIHNTFVEKANFNLVDSGTIEDFLNKFVICFLHWLLLPFLCLKIVFVDSLM